MDSLNFNKILQIKKNIFIFKKSDKMIFFFKVDCELKDRIKYIYKIIFPGFQKMKFYFRFFLSRIAEMIPWSPAKVFIYKIIGIKIGKGVFISPGVIIDVHFPKLIKIDDYVILGWGARLFTHEFFGKIYKLGRIKIGEGAIIGAFASIRCGVEIKKNDKVALQEIISHEK